MKTVQIPHCLKRLYLQFKQSAQLMMVYDHFQGKLIHYLFIYSFLFSFVCLFVCFCLFVSLFVGWFVYLFGSRGSSGSIVSDYGLDDRAIEVRSPAGAEDFFFCPLCPDRLWGPPSLLYNGYRGSFPRG
jgi:hypothetical protein